MDQHTPVPIKVEREKHCLYTLRTDRHRAIAECYGQNDTETRLIAEELATAINSHQAMKEALEGLFKHCSMIHKYWGDEGNAKEAHEAIEQAKQALLLANGGQP